MNWAASVVGICVCAALFMSSVSRAEDQPHLMSLDYCSDQFALALADREQIVGLSPDADAVHSFFRDRAAGLPKFSGSTEDVLIADPDLVLRTWQGDQRTLALFRDQGIAVSSTTLGSDPEAIFDNLARMGDAMGQPEKTRQLLSDYRARLQALRAIASTGVRAAYLTSSGFSAGEGTFVDAVIQLAGFQTLSAELELKGWSPLPLEAFVMNPPDVIIASFFDLQDKPPANWSIVRHPRFAKMMEEIPTIIVPGRYLSCNGFFFIDAAEYIRDQATRLGVIEPTGSGTER